MAAIGRILLEYGELELTLLHCVQVPKGDLDLVLKAMFRVRGEAQRLQIADGLGRRQFLELGLADYFDRLIDAMNHCRKVRNQYAHTQWHNVGDQLCFVALEALAKQKDRIVDLSTVEFYEIDRALLCVQEDYFVYVEDLIAYTNYEARTRIGAIERNPIPEPQSLPKCRLHNGKMDL